MGWNKKVLTLAMAGMSISAFSGGYDKATIWSAKWSAFGGAAVGAVDSADAAYFNPAGLVNGDDAFSLNISPGLSRFHGPSTEDNKSINGSYKVLPIMGGLVKKTLSPKFSLGAGIYTIGGAISEFEEVGLSSGSVKNRLGNQSANLKVYEGTLALGYRVNTWLTFGAAWRVLYGTGEFQSFEVNSATSAIIQSKIEGLNDTAYDGFRVGLQAQNESKSMSFGVVFRSGVELDLQDGTASGMAHGSTGSSAAFDGVTRDTKAKSEFPWNIQAGGHFSFGENTSLHYQYGFTKYSELKKIEISGTLKASMASSSGAGANALANGAGNIPLYWEDAHIFSLGFEHILESKWATRIGASYGTQVVNDGTAKNTFTAPGGGPGYYIGTGKKFKDMTFDLTFEYTHDGGSSGGHSLALETADASGNREDGYFLGDFRAEAYQVHASFIFPL